MRGLFWGMWAVRNHERDLFLPQGVFCGDTFASSRGCSTLGLETLSQRLMQVVADSNLCSRHHSTSRGWPQQAEGRNGQQRYSPVRGCTLRRMHGCSSSFSGPRLDLDNSSASFIICRTWNQGSPERSPTRN